MKHVNDSMRNKHNIFSGSGSFINSNVYLPKFGFLACIIYNDVCSVIYNDVYTWLYTNSNVRPYAETCIFIGSKTVIYTYAYILFAYLCL